jgi:hypothetical protein
MFWPGHRHACQAKRPPPMATENIRAPPTVFPFAGNPQEQIKVLIRRVIKQTMTHVMVGR